MARRPCRGPGGEEGGANRDGEVSSWKTGMVARWSGGDGRASDKRVLGREPPGGPAPTSRKSSPLTRQASRSPPSAYRIRNSAARPGGANLSRVTRTSVRCPTTSRPSRIHARRLSSSLSAATWVRTPARAEGRLGGSRTRSWTPARRASAANRPKRSARLAADIAAPSNGLKGRSSRSRSTVLSWRSIAAIASASSREPGVRTTSQSSWTPRATASTGSRLLARSR
jgi:hypothetical protein